MEPKDILTEEETKIYKEAEKNIKKLIGELNKKGPKIEKLNVAKSGLKMKLSPFIDSDLTKFWSIIEEAKKLYFTLKKESDQSGSTHEFITSQALDIINITDTKIQKDLQKNCIAPDKESKLRNLIFEGHFYGKITENDDKHKGNFLERIFGDLNMGFIGIINRYINDIDETAQSNFIKYYTHALANGNQLEKLGWAAHYIQDLTAPHHVGNMAIGFESITDNCETHFPFEKYAKGYVYANPTVFKNKAQEIYHEFKQSLTGKEPMEIADEVQKRAIPNIQKVKAWDSSAWTEAICDAIPLAIGSTAFIFDHLND